MQYATTTAWTALLIIGIFLPAPIRAVVWAGSLVWKGVACVVNSARCGRALCHLTGPFFLVMAVITAAYGAGVANAVKAVALWLVSERLFGKFLTDNRSR